MADEPFRTFRSYHNRAQRVYWDRSTPACRAGGPDKAQCLLEPNHDGPHYGNGFDEWGPKDPISWGGVIVGVKPGVTPVLEDDDEG